LVAEQADGAPVPSLVTVQRAVRRDLTPGERAGLRKGERERRKFDVFLQRPPSARNAAWEADHVEARVEVEVGGRLVKPWVTRFVDACHNAIAGTAVTPGAPSRESILAALRAAILRCEPFGPVGGLPAQVRIDRGKDFLSRTVAGALGAFAVRVTPLPGYTPHLKGTVETVNGAVERMLFAGLPRYTHVQTLASGAPVDPDAPALAFAAFVAEVLAWVKWWNGQHTIAELGGLTPLASWTSDPSPVEDVDPAALWMFTLEDDRKTRKITKKGVARGRGRYYVADWMTGLGGTAVRLRYMPHHDHEIEVFRRRHRRTSGRGNPGRPGIGRADQGGAHGPSPQGAAVARRPGGGGTAPPRPLRRSHHRRPRPAARRGHRRGGGAGAGRRRPGRAGGAGPPGSAAPPAATGRVGPAARPRPGSHSDRQRHQRGAAVTGCQKPGLEVTGERADHYLGLPGAHIVATDALLMVRDNLADVLDAKAMMCVHGGAGLGKTLSVNASLRDLAPDAVCRIQFRARPTPRDIRHVLFEALDIGGDPPAKPIEFDAVLKDVLSQRFRVLVCDEAQWLSRECFEYWRHLWDDRRTDIAIVFVGGGDCYQVLRREPMLSSRVYVWQEFQRLPASRCSG
jgi:AAA domain/Mu transposase, C-terminal